LHSFWLLMMPSTTPSKPSQAAIAALVNANLIVNPVVYAAGGTNGIVAAQSIAAGTFVSNWSAVGLTVYSG
jgi:hypothetical protein